MIDNLHLIKPLLNFTNPGDFYHLLILKRKKDQSTDKANHQSSRTIKTYSVESIDYLESKYDEIKDLCEYFKARAYIHVNKQNHADIGLNMITKIAERIKSGQINQKYVFDSVVGEVKLLENRWVVDIDQHEVSPLMIAHIEYGCRPITQFKYDENGFENGYINSPKVEAIIPTLNGYHLITKRFDKLEFLKKYPDIDIQKKNPTILYIPSSIS